ncbi:23S rRNA (adenine(2030)-N(6))-methyltransferase RlmJ [Legionella waltersii]|uniref:Ribosomal RNA large subunit methyltransferase J n=1 Tax=Legionella waltersii TaxID=66969 RepID=A0A0W1AM23_9GAMM|nr:23S rRNA (adenine(2030)-N(6))-methyltransferase RlmJ [Legionella waltersii]KTD82383.1 protein involved in catabolism of external DNA [Legionella waltersii]SNV03602.1 protein involved in catabolism of external DNA [Legionella waltersii]
MLSYQHGYHAGNFADVVKHIGLTRLISYLIQKEKPLFYLETHSGKGLYDLYDRQAQKTGEYKEGIQLIWPDRNKLDTVFENYFKCVAQVNHGNALRSYPGSPYFAIHLLRHEDRLYFCELHPKEFDALSKLSQGNKRVHYSNTDGLDALKSLLPPQEKRGLIFIDPAYEQKEEYKEIPEILEKAYKRFSTGVFCIWYPVVNKAWTNQLLRGLHSIKAKNCLRIEFNLGSMTHEGMTGCGLWVINPPYTFALEMKTALTQLKSYFNPVDSYYTIDNFSV